MKREVKSFYFIIFSLNLRFRFIDLEINEYKKENENLKARLVLENNISEIYFFLIVPGTKGNSEF